VTEVDHFTGAFGLSSAKSFIFFREVTGAYDLTIDTEQGQYIQVWSSLMDVQV